MKSLKSRAFRLLRWSEKYTKTDMRYLVSSTSWLNLQFLVTSGSALLMSIVFANFLSKEVFGTYQYLLSISALLSAFTLSGYNTAITRSVSRGFEGTLRASIKPQLRWNIFPALIGLAISLYYLFQGNLTLGLGVACVAVSLPLITTFNSYVAHLSGKGDFKRVALYGIISSVSYYAMLFVVVLQLPEALPLIVVNLGISALAAMLFFIKTAREVSTEASADPDAPRYARHLSAMNVLGACANQVDNFIVFHLLGPAQLATYAIAKLLPERIGSLFKLLTFSAAMPRFAQRGFSEINQTILRKVLLLTLLVFITIAFYAIIAQFIFAPIYPAYADAIPYSQFYALTFVSYIGGAISSIFYAHQKLRPLYVLNTGIPLLQILLQVVGVLAGGLAGLIAGRVLALTISSVATVVLYRRMAQL